MRRLLVFLLAFLPSPPLSAAELTPLTNDNWQRLVPKGKEVDCILGDFAFRSDRLAVVVAKPTRGRNANMTVKQVSGAVIDLTIVDNPNDQLSAFYPGKRLHVFTKAEIVKAKGKTVKLVCIAPAATGKPEVRVEYELTDGQPYLVARSVLTNKLDKPMDVPLEDDVRADGFDKRVKAGETDLFWVHDHHFEQAYGIVVDGHSMRTRSDRRTSVLSYTPKNGKGAKVTLAPGASHTLERRIIPGSHLLQVKGEAARLQGKPVVFAGGHFVDPKYQPIADVDVTLKQGDVVYGTARTDKWGWVKAWLPKEQFTMSYSAVGRGSGEDEADLASVKDGKEMNKQYELPEASVVVAEVSDEKGNPIPCKVEFKGTGDTENPNWGPPASRQAVLNLYYSANGRFTVPIDAGTYDVLVSHGPEHNVARAQITVEKGKATPLKATLRRAFETPGWVSTDYHSHSSPSGDNTGDQRGRVLNLLAEQIDFAPCTEHNRLSSYMPHLKALNAERFLGTCVGMELTGSPLPLNHQNAFPLVLKPRTQNNGGPVVDAYPPKQIRRLAEWDAKAEKLVQQNHPDIGWLFYDKNGDGKPDDGYKEGIPFMHVIEVHPIHQVLQMQAVRIRVDSRGKRTNRNNSIFNWLQLLNQGYRIWGVVNTDAHYNFHGSGGLRNYVRCDTKVPGDIDALDIVRESKKGRLVMTTAPYLQVKLDDALPGDDLARHKGKAMLEVSVHCADWYDVDRVQVLFNGRPEPKLNFTRATHPELFSDKAQRFAHKVELELEADTHVIVTTVGNKPLGQVVGPMWGRQLPTAISNPIFVDVDGDGDGFKPNKDTLGQPLPTKAGR